MTAEATSLRSGDRTSVIGSKVRSAADAVKFVVSGMTVAVGSLSAEPLTLTQALWNRGRELSDVTIVAGMMLTGYPFVRSREHNAFSLRTWFMPGTLLSGDARDLRAEFLPLTWAQTIRYLERSRFDVALLQVSPADKDGFHSFGTNSSQSYAVLRSAKLVIAEVNEAMPRTCGQSRVHESDLDILVEANHPLPEFPHREGDDIDRAIGLSAAQFVQDGATLQFGIGTIPGAALDGVIALGRKNLRIISQLTDPARKLIEAGACVSKGPKAIVGDILGTHALYQWIDNNPAVFMSDGLGTHSIESLQKRERFTSINSCLEIDVFGQVNSESLDGKQVGGIGGSVDFGIGAQLDGGTSVMALRSTTKHGLSRIVRTLQAGPVTVPRSLIQIVVTEHGVADLRSMTVRERAEALVRIAHPDHRADLMRAPAFTG